MLKVPQAAFSVACFWGFSDILKCSGHLQMVPYPLDKQAATSDTPHVRLMSFAMDLAALCDKMVLMDAIWLFIVKNH